MLHLQLRRKAATDIIEAHPNWPVYADVFEVHSLHLDAQYGQT